MIRVAQERISDLFSLAEAESRRGSVDLPKRYTQLARRIGMRYNVRLLAEYRDLYCRGCSNYWVEGRTVRTRLRNGRQVRTCLACGRTRRVPLREPRLRAVATESAARRPAAVQAVALAEEGEGDELDSEMDEGDEG